MKHSCKKIVLLKNQFARKKDGAGKFFHDRVTEFLQLFDEINAKSIAIFRIPAEAIGKFHKTLKIFFFYLA